MAWHAQDQSGEYRVSWLDGDWSFYAMAEGFASEADFTAALQQTNVVERLTPGNGGDSVVTIENRPETVDAVLADVPLPPGFDVDVLREHRGPPRPSGRCCRDRQPGRLVERCVGNSGGRERRRRHRVGGGPQAPSRENTASGLGCEFG